MKTIISVDGLLDSSTNINIITEDDVNLDKDIISVNGYVQATMNTPSNHPLTGRHKFLIPREKIILITDFVPKT